MPLKQPAQGRGSKSRHHPIWHRPQRPEIGAAATSSVIVRAIGIAARVRGPTLCLASACDAELQVAPAPWHVHGGRLGLSLRDALDRPGQLSARTELGVGPAPTSPVRYSAGNFRCRFGSRWSRRRGRYNAISRLPAVEHSGERPVLVQAADPTVPRNRNVVASSQVSTDRILDELKQVLDRCPSSARTPSRGCRREPRFPLDTR